MLDTIPNQAPPAPGIEAAGPLDIARDRCKGCELCVSVCPKHVLELDPTLVNALGHHPVRITDQDACTSCALCVRVCPDSVFTVYARPEATVA